MRIQELPPDKVLEALASAPEGLSAAEASRRLAEYGANRVERVRKVPLWLRFLRQFTHLFAVLLWAAAGLSLVAARQQPGSGMETLAAAIVLVIMINGGFAFWQDYRSERAVEELQALLPHTVRVKRDGVLREAPGDELVPGDIILLREGDPVPADGRLIRALGLQVSTAALTGESVPLGHDARADTTADLADARNILPAGSSIVSGEGEAVVFATGMRTLLGGIAHATQTAGAQLSPLQREVTRLSRIIAVLSVGLGAAFLFSSLMLGISFAQASVFAIGVTAANVPEGLLPTVTLALAMASRRLAKKKVLVRTLAAVESLGAATVICTDKTGTLTENRMAARSLFVDGSARPAGPEALQDPPGALLRETAALCQTLVNVDGHLTGDPTEIALVELTGGLPERTPRDGTPFDPDRRRMSLVFDADGESTLHLKGALEAVLPLCSDAATSAGPHPLTDDSRAAIQAAEGEMAVAGLRVLAFARRTLPPDTEREDWESKLLFLGLVGLEDPPRPEVPEAVALCRAAGIRVIMVTGDHARTAEAIARRIGLITTHHARVVTGDQLERMSKTRLQLALDAREIIFARTRAEQKFHIVEALQAKGDVVAVTGDGVNDAPALRQADVGIAMGASGTEVAREAADMILLDDNFAGIVAAVTEGRTVFDNIRKFLTYILTSNVAELAPYLAFAAFGLPLALTVAQILAIDLGTDMFPALALATEKPEPDGMAQPPRARHQRLVDASLLARAYCFLGALQAAAGMAAFLLTLAVGGWIRGAPLSSRAPLYLEATTACLATIVVMQIANLFACRSRRRSTFRLGFFENPLLPAALAIEATLIVAIVYTAAGNALFATVPLGAAPWGRAAIFAVLFLAAEELRKSIQRRRRRLA